MCLELGGPIAKPANMDTEKVVALTTKPAIVDTMSNPI